MAASVRNWRAGRSRLCKLPQNVAVRIRVDERQVPSERWMNRIQVQINRSRYPVPRAFPRILSYQGVSCPNVVYCRILPFRSRRQQAWPRCKTTWKVKAQPITVEPVLKEYR
uniref:(northern house mosquito) hypothetical protein n=1 Tax=Culex pipiens TaxID=7175 RepID=A0A8D8KT53_CULPI